MQIADSKQNTTINQDSNILSMTRIDFVIAVALIIAIVLSALSVSFVAQRNRHLFNELEVLRAKNTELNSRWSRLLLERSTLSSSARIENVARKKLQLRPATPQDTVIIE